MDAGAIQSLRLNGPARSKEILEAALARNQHRAATITAALDWIRSNPRAITGPNLKAVTERAG